MMTKDEAAYEIYKINHCRHETEYGTNAFVPFGTYGEGWEQCLLCGKIICTETAEETDRDLAGYPAY